MELFSRTRAKLDEAGTMLQNLALLAVVSLATAIVALFVALTHRVS